MADFSGLANFAAVLDAKQKNALAQEQAKRDAERLLYEKSQKSAESGLIPKLDPVTNEQMKDPASGLLQFVPSPQRKQKEELESKGKQLDYNEKTRKASTTGLLESLPVETKKAAMSALSGIQALDEFEGLVASGDKLSGFIGPRTPVIGEFVGGTKSDAMRGYLDNAVTRVATGANLNKTEEDMFRSFIPNKGDEKNPEIMKYKIRLLRNFFNTYAQGNLPDPKMREIINQQSGGFSEPPKVLGGTATGSARSSAAPATKTLEPGAIHDGYQFKGGNPKDSKNWVPVK
jgi:hypothetical protein